MFQAAAVIGYPAHHSRSPLVHGYWLREHQLSGAYLRIDVPPDQVATFLSSLADQGLAGCNVTVPHKELAYRAAAEVDDIARTLEAANTLWLRSDGTLSASNTDVHGFLANLDQNAPRWDWSRRNALVLGAGGAARAVVHGLQKRGFRRIVVVNRTESRAQELRDQLGKPVIAAPWAEIDRHVWDADLIINTTSLGLKGEGAVEIDFKSARPHALVTDLVYVPLETPFLAAARAHDLQTVDGLGMLLHQAVPGFERWFHVKPTVTDGLRAMILADLGH